MYLGVVLLGNIITLYLTLWGTIELFSKAATPFYFPSSHVWGLELFCILINRCFLSFWFSHPSGWEMVSHCGFDLHSPDDSWCWASFHVLIGQLHVLFEMSKLFAHFKVSYLDFYCWVVDTSPLINRLFTNIFSHSVGCLFTFLMVSFEIQNFKFWWSLIWLFFLLPHVLSHI